MAITHPHPDTAPWSLPRAYGPGEGPAVPVPAAAPVAKHPHYFKQIPPGATHVDVYRVLDLFAVDHPCVQHAVKKLLAAGRRGAKDEARDVQDAIDSLLRWQAMRAEETGA